MSKLEILNLRHASTWEKYKDAPAALVPVEHSLNPCDKCPAHCCHHTCHVSAFEVARIALVLSLELERFVSTTSYDDPESKIGLSVFHPIQLDGGMVCLCFNQRGGGVAPCTFLVDHQGAARCSIYALRPGVCRQYPLHTRDEEGEVAVGDTSMCTPSWLYDERTEDQASASLKAWRDDIEQDRLIVSEWNDEERADRSFNAFARWLLERCREVHGGDPLRAYPRQRRRLGRP